MSWSPDSRKIRLAKYIAYTVVKGILNFDLNTVEPLYNEVLGTMKITLLYQGKKTKKYKELGQAKLPRYKRILLYPTSV